MTPNRSSRRSWSCVAWLLCAAPVGCFADAVSPGYYGSTDDAGTATTPPPASEPTSTSGPSSTPIALEAGAAGVSRGTEAGATTTVGCDLSGRWIATDREVATALGAQEAAHTWIYFELAQTGSSGTVTRGLNCGANVRGISAVAANVD
jgi:hypothetical protein